MKASLTLKLDFELPEQPVTKYISMCNSDQPGLQNAGWWLLECVKRLKESSAQDTLNFFDAHADTKVGGEFLADSKFRNFASSELDYAIEVIRLFEVQQKGQDSEIPLYQRLPSLTESLNRLKESKMESSPKFSSIEISMQTQP